VGVHPSRYDRGYVNPSGVDDLDELAAGNRMNIIDDDRISLH
jgi:hypothetical protein